MQRFQLFATVCLLGVILCASHRTLVVFKFAAVAVLQIPGLFNAYVVA